MNNEKKYERISGVTRCSVVVNALDFGFGECEVSISRVILNSPFPY